MSGPARPPFDPVDEAAAAAYMRKRDLAIVDPFAGPQNDDLIFKVSLSGCRFLMAESFGTTRTDGRSFRAYPFIVGKPSANAFAVETGGLQLCGLDVGLGNAAYEMSLFVFSRSSLFTEIGDAGGEQSPDLPDGSQLAFWIADRLRDRGTANSPPVGIELIPRDGQRQYGAQVLTPLLLRFVWLHEFYHGLNGHTGLLAFQRPDAVLNEMPDETILGVVEIEPEEEAEEGEALRHAMEYDADRSALWMLVRLQQVDLEPIPGLAAWPKPLRLKLAIFAAVMMTFLFDQAARRQARRSGATHPKAQYRLVDLVRTLASHLLDPPGAVKEAFSAVLAEMTALQACLPEFVSASRLLDDLHSTALQRALDDIDDSLADARRQFAPFAYRANVVG